MSRRIADAMLAEVDRKVLAAVKAGSGSRFAALLDRTGLNARVLDRSLQRLRRRGAVSFAPLRGWEVVS